MSTILIVDDVEANRAWLVSLLRYKGYRVLEAINGHEALAVAQNERPDLIITDVLMPVMDGYTFVRQLRSDPAAAATPVIFYTAHYGEREAQEFAVANGVSFVMTKPVEPPQVLAIVERALAGALPAKSPTTLSELAFERGHLRLLTDKLSEKASDLRVANARLRALVNIGLELANEQNSDRLLERVCVAARDLFGASYATIGVVDRHTGALTRIKCDGTPIAAWAQVGTRVNGLFEKMLAERRVVRGVNPAGDPTAIGLPVGHPPVVSYLVAPVASPKHIYGWIFLGGDDEESFHDDDEALVMALAGQMGRVYENGHLYETAQAERDRAQQYLDTAETILLALDLAGRITLVNRYACTLLGWTQQELLGRNFVDTCLPEEIRPQMRLRLDDVQRGDDTVIENPVITKSGVERLIEWRTSILRDPQGRVLGTLSSGTDVTARTQAIAALRRTEERMRFALASADVGIWDIDYRDGHLVWSEILEAQYGLAPGSFDGRFETFLDMVHPDDRLSVRETLDAAVQSGRDFWVQHRAVWRDGTVRWLSGAGRILLDASGQPLRGTGVSLDVTARRTLEEQFQQAQKMEAVGRLAGGIAHDFNNLLTAILGYCELLLMSDGPNASAREDIGEIQRAGNRAAALTRQLLAFSRKQIIDPSIIDVNTIISDMQGMLGRLIGEDVSVRLRLQPGLASVKVDRGQLEQVVMNLVVNARDAMPEGGILTLETENVDLDDEYARTHLATNAGAHVAITVSDTGTGMTPEVRARLFEPFFTTKAPGKGTGLGMATVYGIISRAGGSIGVYSEVGQGTSFHIYLPATSEQAIALPPLDTAAPALEAHTVLVVEDVLELRDLTRRLLERQGYTVLLAANADEALHHFDTQPSIDILLTDVVMPGASGPELARQAMAQRPGLKVIYMSGYTEEAIAHRGVLEPGIAFVHKPFTSDVLGRKIREVLGR